jgi:PAB-dependent poly(A)-specific ribonuclease subunit 3
VAAAAPTFVPGKGLSTSKPNSSSDLSAGIPLERQASDLKVTKEWTPSFAKSDNTDLGEEEYDTSNFDDIDNGEDFSLSWGESASTLPAPPRRCLQTIGLPEPIRQHFSQIDLEALRQMEPNDPRYKELPSRFHSAYCLDDMYSQSRRGTGGSYGYPSGVYKAIDRSDSQVYTLRRVDNVRITPTTSVVAKSVMAKWCEIRHPSICALYNISAERGGVFFLHAYHPASQTLKEKFIDQFQQQQRSNGLINESLIWRILVHLLSGLRLVHMRGLPVRNISISHIILTSGTIARFNGVGIVDVLESDSRKTVADLLVEDMMKLGYVMLSLATRSIATPKNVDQALAAMSRQYSQSFHAVIQTLLAGKANAQQLSQMISDRVHDELDQSMAGADALHSHLRSEYESSRLLRLQLKLSYVCERPDFLNNARWSETGDKYVVKLFRDYVYHQTTGEGYPVMDAGHVMSSLNKLDVGDAEKILLSSRDQKDLLVVSFADVRRCLESAVEELANYSDISRQQRQQQQGQQGANNNSGYNNGNGNNGMRGGSPRSGRQAAAAMNPQHMQQQHHSQRMQMQHGDQHQQGGQHQQNYNPYAGGNQGY